MGNPRKTDVVCMATGYTSIIGQKYSSGIWKMVFGFSIIFKNFENRNCNHN